MPTCSELCPIARSLTDRTYQNGNYPNGKPYVTITTSVHGVSVTALENEFYPGTVRAQVPENAKPSCDLATRIGKSFNHGGLSFANEQCVYVPGKKNWITVSK